MAPGDPRFWLAIAETRLVEWLLNQPLFRQFVGTVHKRVRHLRGGKTEDEMMEEMGGTNEKEERDKERGTLLKHFKEELANQFKDLGGGGQLKSGKDDEPPPPPTTKKY